MPESKLKAPFPYFGGKSKIAREVWSRLGDVRNYVEPFIGSAAVLLNRPHAPGVETINDEDCYVANFWRATASEAGCLEVAKYADYPVSEIDLHARHRHLVLGPDVAGFLQQMRTDPDYFNPKFAGWWAWGLCCWIGGGWCTSHGERADGSRKETLPSLSSSKGCNLQVRRPAISQGGWGLNAAATLHNKRPSLSDGRGGDGTKGVTSKLPHQIPNLSGDAGATGRGVCKTLPEGRPVITDAFSRGRGVNANDDASTCAARREWLTQWFMDLRDRLRAVRSCCGDWQRVCDSDSTLTRIGGDFKDGKQSGTGVFLDPPYSKNAERMKAIVAELLGEAPRGGGLFGETDLVSGSSNRADALYGNDNKQDVDRLVARVHVWCREKGQDPRIRVALCGYEGEHNALEDLGWTKWSWEAQGGYGNRKKARGQQNTNKKRERVWFSPACLAGIINGPSYAQQETNDAR
ncbi:MAG: DNA adenine methylase [Planctomycetota bacterium]